MMEIKFLGGAREVGRSAILVDTGVEKFLMDYGLEVQHMGVPQKPKANLDAVFISHCHLDHSGMVPSLFLDGYRGPVYATGTTLEFASLLLADSLKVQAKRGDRRLYEPVNLTQFAELQRAVQFGKPQKFPSSTVTMNSAGHVPGAATTLIDTGKKRVLYTGDIKFLPTALVKGAKDDYKDIDVLICESTYSHRDHPERCTQTDKMREAVQETLYNNGTALMPCFAVGRSQEVLLTLHDLGFPIYMDGMCLEATRIAISHPEHTENASKLADAFNHVRKIHNDKMRADAISKPSIIITTAGMMTGGPVDYYMRRLWKDEKSSIMLTGYQVEGTPGRILMDTGRYISSGLNVDVKMRFEFIDLSAHTDRAHMVDFIKKVNPAKVVMVHGDRTEEFAKEFREAGFDAHAPANGETITV